MRRDSARRDHRSRAYGLVTQRTGRATTTATAPDHREIRSSRMSRFGLEGPGILRSFRTTAERGDRTGRAGDLARWSANATRGQGRAHEVASQKPREAVGPVCTRPPCALVCGRNSAADTTVPRGPKTTPQHVRPQPCSFSEGRGWRGVAESVVNDSPFLLVPGRLPSNPPIRAASRNRRNRYLPIWICAVQATAIASPQQGHRAVPALTHDLLQGHLCRRRPLKPERGDDHLAARRRVLLRSGASARYRFFSVFQGAGPSRAIAWRSGRTVLDAEEVIARQWPGSLSPGRAETEVERFQRCP